MSTKPIPAEFWQRLNRSRLASTPARERAADYVRDLTGRPREGDDAKDAPVVPLIYAWREALNPSILDRNPVPHFKDSDSADAVKRQRALVFEKLAEYFWEKQQIRRRVIEPALEACQTDGLSAVGVEFDPIARIPRVTFLPTRSFDIDLDAQHPDIRFVRWMSVRKSLPLASARQLWPGFNFSTDSEIGDFKNGSYVEEAVSISDMPEGESSVDSYKTVSVWCVYAKGTDPYTKSSAAKPTRKRGEKLPPEGAMLATKEPVVIYFAYAKPKDSGGQGPCVLTEIGREAWVDYHMLPEPDQFPISVLRLTIDCDSFWPRSMFDPVRGAADQANWAAKYEDEDARMSVMRIILAVKQALGKKKAEDILRSNENLKVHTVDTAQQAENAFKILDFVKPNVIAANNADRSMMRFEAAARVADLTPQARSHESSAGAQLRSQVSGARTGRPAALITEFAGEITQKLIQCARLHMTALEVADIVGEELLQFDTEPVMKTGIVKTVDSETGAVVENEGEVPEVDENGTPKYVHYSKVWDEAATPEEIIKETDLFIDPFSMRRMDKESEVQMLVQLKQAVQADLSFMQTLGIAPKPDAVARLMFGVTARVAEAMGIDDFALLAPNPEELVQFAPPDVASGATGGGGEVNLNGQAQAEAGGEAANPPGS